MLPLLPSVSTLSPLLSLFNRICSLRLIPSRFPLKISALIFFLYSSQDLYHDLYHMVLQGLTCLVWGILEDKLHVPSALEVDALAI